MMAFSDSQIKLFLASYQRDRSPLSIVLNRVVSVVLAPWIVLEGIPLPTAIPDGD